MSQSNVDTVRDVFTLVASFGGDIETEDVRQRLSDATLSEYFDPGVEWLPAAQSPLAAGTYRGYEGVRGFWAEFLSAWDEYEIEPVEFVDRGDQVAVVMRMKVRTHGMLIDQLWSSLSTLRDGKVVRVQGFNNRDGALDAAKKA